MPVDDLSTELFLPTREQLRANYKRDYKFAKPDADMSPKGQPDIDASAAADALLPIYANAAVLGDGTTLVSSRGRQLLRHGRARGLSGLLPAVGSSGHVTITASTGGTTIFAGDEVKDVTRQLFWTCTTTGLYQSGGQVPVSGVSTGTATNLAPGSVLQWTSPRPGCAPTCTVFEQGDGSGLSGGAEAETEEEFIDRIIDAQSNPAASGNDAEVQEETEGTPGLGIEKGFSIPAIKGPCTTAVMFTMRPSVLGGSRLPNATHRALVEANLKTVFPADWGIFMPVILAEPTDVVLHVTWASTARGWQDAAPFPALGGQVGNVISAYAFRVTTGVATATPVVGQTIGLYDPQTRRFQRKRIASVVVVTPTFSSALGASDPYLPSVGHYVSPWSDSLDLLVEPLLTDFGRLGPGEQVDPLPDPGKRQRRQPASPGAWPSVMTERTMSSVTRHAAVEALDFASPTLPHATPVGTPGVSSKLLVLGEFAIVKKP